VEGFSEHGYEPLGSTKDEQLLEPMSSCKFHKKDFASFS
jgi:hypothetical protein